MNDKNIIKLDYILRRLKYPLMRADKEAFHIFLNTMTFEQFQTIIIFLNGVVRGAPRVCREFFPGYVKVGSLISPNNNIQREMLRKIWNGLKQIEQPRYQAAMMYYLTNNLHLFYDGNGRTSRLLFSLFSEEDYNMEDVEALLTHNEEDINPTLLVIDYEELVGIAKLSEINDIASRYVLEDYIKKGILPNQYDILNRKIKTSGPGLEGDFDSEDIYLPNHLRSPYLSLPCTLNFSLLDNNSYYSVSGMAMMIMNAKLGNLDDCMNYMENKYQQCSECYKKENHDIIFPVTASKTDAPYYFKNWGYDQYVEVIDIAEKVKKQQLETMIDFFVHPLQYQNEFGVPMAELFVHSEQELHHTK